MCQLLSFLPLPNASAKERERERERVWDRDGASGSMWALGGKGWGSENDTATRSLARSRSLSLSLSPSLPLSLSLSRRHRRLLTGVYSTSAFADHSRSCRPIAGLSLAPALMLNSALSLPVALYSWQCVAFASVSFERSTRRVVLEINNSFK